MIEGKEAYEAAFDALVREGESVDIDEVHVKAYCPLHAWQTVMRIIFYATESTEGRFVDYQGVKQPGGLSIDTGRQFQSVEDQNVEVKLLIGATLIYETATKR